MLERSSMCAIPNLRGFASNKQRSLGRSDCGASIAIGTNVSGEQTTITNTSPQVEGAAILRCDYNYSNTRLACIYDQGSGQLIRASGEARRLGGTNYLTLSDFGPSSCPSLRDGYTGFCSR
jgi:hypothetical protein